MGVTGWSETPKLLGSVTVHLAFKGCSSALWVYCSSSYSCSEVRTRPCCGESEKLFAVVQFAVGITLP